MLDKQPDVRSVRVEETWRRLFAKVLLKLKVPEDTMAFQDDQQCTRLKSGIGSAVHKVQAIWDEKSTTEDWVFLLIYAKNAFNEINQILMLFIVCHLFPSRALFVFNCHHHWSSLVFWYGNGTARFMHSREGVKQGDPL